MPVETQALVAALQGATETRVQGWTFWTGQIDGYPVIVSRTQKGMTNAAAATALATAVGSRMTDPVVVLASVPPWNSWVHRVGPPTHCAAAMGQPIAPRTQPWAVW